MIDKKDFKGTVLRVLGKIIEGPMDIGKGHQSINIKEGDLIKIEKKWGEYSKKILEESETKSEPVFLGVIEDGVLDFGILKKKLEYLGSVKKSLPPKSKSEFDSIVNSFYSEAAKKIEESVKKDQKAIIGGHRFCLERLKKYLKKDLVFVDVSSTGKTGLNEIIKRGYVERVIGEDRLGKEAETVEKLLEEISKNRRYAYGFDEVKKAVEMNSIEKFMITDKKVKDSKMSGNFKKINDMMRKISSKKGDIMIIKSSEEPGEKLDGLGGIGAILRFKIN